MNFTLVERKLHSLDICIVGVGGAGNNIIRYLKDYAGMSDARYVAINTDTQVLDDWDDSGDTLEIYTASDTDNRGLGAGARPEYGREAAENCREAIKQRISAAQMVILVAGMGGGTGTGAAPVVAEIAQEEGVLVIGIAVMPFLYESRDKRAQQGLENLIAHSDSHVILYNQEVMEENREAGILLEEAFDIPNKYIANMLSGLYRMLVTKGTWNLDFADFKSVVQGGGRALIGHGVSSGDNGLAEAVQNAINNPLLGSGRRIAVGKALINLTGPVKLSTHEEVMRLIADRVADDEIEVINGYIAREGENIDVCLVLVGAEDATRVESEEDNPSLSDYLLSGKGSEIKRLDVMDFYQRYLRANQTADQPEAEAA